MITKAEMKRIDTEITYIEKKLDILSPDNPIENQQREKLLCRLDYIEYQLDRFIISEQKNRLRLISS